MHARSMASIYPHHGKVWKYEISWPFTFPMVLNLIKRASTCIHRNPSHCIIIIFCTMRCHKTDCNSQRQREVTRAAQTHHCMRMQWRRSGSNLPPDYVKEQTLCRFARGSVACILSRPLETHGVSYHSLDNALLIIRLVSSKFFNYNTVL